MKTFLAHLQKGRRLATSLYLKIDNPPYMPLVIEATDESGPLGLPAISVCPLRRTERRSHARPRDVLRAWPRRRQHT